jgi:hypothetical protein
VKLQTGPDPRPSPESTSRNDPDAVTRPEQERIVAIDLLYIFPAKGN